MTQNDLSDIKLYYGPIYQAGDNFLIYGSNWKTLFSYF